MKARSSLGRWAALGLCLALLGEPGHAAPAAGRTSGAAPAVLRIRNRTPFMLTVYIAGIRSGWIKPFRTESFKGLKPGLHQVYVASHYATATWGPEKIQVPGTWNLTPPADARSSETLEATLASRVYSRNRNSLVACDRLAERRGEELKGRADFEIKVDGEGKPAIAITGELLSERRKSCYAAVSRTWEYPSTGEPYTISFQHIP